MTKTPEELRAEIIAWVNETDSTEKLAEVLDIIQHPKYYFPALTEAEEEGLARGMADYYAGRTISHEEFLDRLKRRKEARVKEHQAS